MPIQLSDLNYDQKCLILKNIQNQMAAFEYQRIIDSIGEEALIELFLQQIEKQPNQIRNHEQNNNLKNVKESKLHVRIERFNNLLSKIKDGLIIICFLVFVWFGYYLFKTGATNFEKWWGKILYGISIVSMFYYIFINDNFVFLILRVIVIILSTFLVLWGLIQAFSMLF